MRLFIGIDFDDEIKEGLYNIGRDIAAQAVKGNFTLKENIHLTLRFLGEYADAAPFKTAMDNAARQVSPFHISTGHLGVFGNNILWVSVEKNNELNQLYNALENELLKIGIPKEGRGLSPHITIARKTVLSKSLNEFKCPVFETKVSSIALFESARINNKLTYTPLFFAALTAGEHSSPSD